MKRYEFSHVPRILFYKEFNIEAVCVLLGILRSILKFWVRFLLVLSQLTRFLIRNGYVIFLIFLLTLFSGCKVHPELQLRSLLHPVTKFHEIKSHLCLCN